jgi:hypothetical protein
MVQPAAVQIKAGGAVIEGDLTIPAKVRGARRIRAWER